MSYIFLIPVQPSIHATYLVANITLSKRQCMPKLIDVYFEMCGSNGSSSSILVQHCLQNGKHGYMFVNLYFKEQTIWCLLKIAIQNIWNKTNRNKIWTKSMKIYSFILITKHSDKLKQFTGLPYKIYKTIVSETMFCNWNHQHNTMPSKSSVPTVPPCIDNSTILPAADLVTSDQTLPFGNEHQ